MTETTEVECPECGHRFESSTDGDVAVCEDCNASFIRHTHTVGDGDEVCYACSERAVGVYVGTHSEEGAVELALCDDHSPDSAPLRWLGESEAAA